jgi:hypothetical protein
MEKKKTGIEKDVENVEVFAKELGNIMGVLIKEAKSGHETMLDMEVACMTVVCDEVMKQREFDPAEEKIYDALRMTWMAAVEYQKASARMVEDQRNRV